MRKGLQNICEKKNNLYKKYLKLRSREANDRYKIYKNKQKKDKNKKVLQKMNNKRK